MATISAAARMTKTGGFYGPRAGQVLSGLLEGFFFGGYGSSCPQSASPIITNRQGLSQASERVDRYAVDANFEV